MALPKENTLSFGAIESFAGKIRKIVDDNQPESNITKKLQWLVTRLKGSIFISNSPSERDVSGGSLVVYDNGSFSIYLSPQTSPLRDNFTIAHELGHYFLHTDSCSSGSEDGIVSFHRYGSDKKEWEANRFAAAFLMPKAEFIEKFREFNKSVTLLSGYFEVSSPAVEVRIKCLGL